MECLSYCVSNSIDLSRLHAYYKAEYPLVCAIRSRDVLRINPEKSGKILVFIFKNGTVVSWGLKRHQVRFYLEILKPFVTQPVSFSVHDEFHYKQGKRTGIEPHGYFDVDCLSIDPLDDHEELKLSLSYGFSQSVKLQYFERTLEALIEKYEPFIKNLSTQGVMRVTRNQVRQIIGEILGAKSEMNLISNFLYHPKYFWQHPTLEEHYIMLERYLHLPRRVAALNHRLDTINEIFDMFSAYLENRHAHRLEIIIIALIAIEIVFGVLNFHF
jgi:uncharacterized Rmd1/YagE family protein